MEAQLFFFKCFILKIKAAIKETKKIEYIDWFIANLRMKPLSLMISMIAT